MAKFGFIDVNSLDHFPSLPFGIADTIVYSRSKFGNVLFSVALAKRLKGTNVTVNSLNPGTVDTGIYRNYAFLVKEFSYSFISNFCKVS